VFDAQTGAVQGWAVRPAWKESRRLVVSDLAGPLVLAEPDILFATRDGGLWRWGRDGAQKLAQTDAFVSAPTPVADSSGGVRLVIAGPRSVRAYEPATGRVAWEWKVPARIIEAPPGFPEAGLIFARTADGALHALDGGNGNLLLRSADGGQPILLTASSVYVLIRGDNLRRIDRGSGWELEALPCRNFRFLLARPTDDVLYLGAEDGRWFAVRGGNN